MIALTHLPSTKLQQCELTHLQREPIRQAVAQQQHAAYRQALEQAGLQVHVFDMNCECPDAAFIEDVAIVLDELIVLTPMGVASRKSEIAAWRAVLSEFRPVVELPSSACLEGGDALLVGKELLVGLSSRTNRAAIDALVTVLKPFGYRVRAIRVNGCLHLKTACTALDDETLLANLNWISRSELPALRTIEVQEAWGANFVRLPNNTILANAQHPTTIREIERRGQRVLSVDLSEFSKAEAGPTCLSLLIR